MYLLNDLNILHDLSRIEIFQGYPNEINNCWTNTSHGLFQLKITITTE